MARSKVPKKLCLKCLKEKNIQTAFFNSYNDWHSDGKMPYCKQCLENELDENNPASVKNIMRAIDKPYKPDFWDKAMQDDKKTLGIYLKNINFNHQYETYEDSVEPSKGKKENESSIVKTVGDVFVEEDKVYSKVWLGYYYPSEIEYLQEYLSGLNRDFRILTKSHQDYAKKIAKASLHMDKCFQDMQNDKKGSEKRYKEAKEVFDTLSKSAQFSEDKRGANDVSLGSFSQITEMVENNTYVYEHKNDLDKDQYDGLLDEFSHIDKSL